MQNQKYHISSRFTHWVMAFIIIALLALGFYMTNLLDKESANRMMIYNLHKSFGVIVLCLIVIRIFIRLSKPVPPFPNTIPNTVQKLAYITHISLYILMILMPLSGYLMSNSFGYHVHLFGLTLPMFVGKNLEMAKFYADAHQFLGFTFLAFLSLHLAGVIKHRFFDRPENNVLERMI